MNIVITFGGSRMIGKGVIASTAAAVLAMSLVACGSATGAPPGSIAVVASTNVYGELVQAVAGRLAGDKIQITSIITDPSVDPHSYEASTRTELTISRADLIVENGGGYDDFVDRLRESAGGDATVINAVDVSGKPQTDSLNEHVWYDLPTVAKVVDRITAFLTSHDPGDAAYVRQNARRFTAKLHAMQAEQAQIKTHAGGDGVAVTEPVANYLLTACGLVVRTPKAFSDAVEQGTDVAPRVLNDTIGLFVKHEVELLVYNEQTAGPETDALRGAAADDHIPSVPVTETLPSGTTYLAWMQANLTAIAAAEGFSLT